MAIAVFDYLDGLALAPAKRIAAAAAMTELAGQLAAGGIEALVTFDLDWLAQIFAGWQARLPSIASPQNFPRQSHPDHTMIVLLREGGRYVGASAQRLIWLDGSLRQAMESGVFFYGEPANLPAGWRAECRVDLAGAITDCAVIYNCALRLHPERSAGDLTSRRLLRLSLGLAAIHWRWSWMVGRSGEAMATRFAPLHFGATSSAHGLYVWPPGAAAPEKWQHLLFTRRGDFERQLCEDPAFGRGEALRGPLPLLGDGHAAGS